VGFHSWDLEDESLRLEGAYEGPHSWDLRNESLIGKISFFGFQIWEPNRQDLILGSHLRPLSYWLMMCGRDRYLKPFWGTSKPNRFQCANDVVPSSYELHWDLMCVVTCKLHKLSIWDGGGVASHDLQIVKKL